MTIIWNVQLYTQEKDENWWDQLENIFPLTQTKYMVYNGHIFYIAFCSTMFSYQNPVMRSVHKEQCDLTKTDSEIISLYL